MVRALLRPSSGAHDYNVDYHTVRLVLGLLWVGRYVRAGWNSVRASGYSMSLAIACSPDTTPVYQHLTSKRQQPKMKTTNVVINIIVVGS